MQLKSSPVIKMTVNSSQTSDSICVATHVSAAVDQQSVVSSPSCSPSSLSSQASDEMLITKPHSPHLFPSKLSDPAKCLQPNVSVILRGEGEKSLEEADSTAQDVSSVPSISSGTSSDKNAMLSAESTYSASGVGSDMSLEPLTFVTNSDKSSNTVTSLSEARTGFELLVAGNLKLESKLLDMNENIGKKESASSHCVIKDSEMVSDYRTRNGISDPLKTITGLFDKSHYLPATTNPVVVNMVLSSVVTKPEDQSSTVTASAATAGTVEADAANHSQDNSECDMSISDEASTHDAPSDVQKDRELQPEKPSVTEPVVSDDAVDANKKDEAEPIPSSEGETRTITYRPKSPVSEKRESDSKSEKRGRSRSSEHRKHQSRSSERKNDRSGGRSGNASVTRSPVHSPQRDSSRHRDRRRSRSSSRSRRRRSSSREYRSRTRRTSSSRGSRRREHSRSRSRESRRKRSRSKSSDSRRRSRSTERGRHKRESRSRSRDRSRRDAGRDRRSSRDEDKNVRRDDRSVRQVDRASSPSSKNHRSDRSRNSSRQRRRSPSQSDRVVTKRDERASPEKSRNSEIRERAVRRRQSDSDSSSSESSRRQKTREESPEDNNRIAVISSSSGINRRLTPEEFESDEDPPADPPAAYDPSEPTEDNFRDNRNVSDHRQTPPRWVSPANHRMPMVDTTRPPPGFPARLPAPPSPRFPPRPPREAVMPPNHFGVAPSDGGRPPLPSLINVPPPLPRPTEVLPPFSTSRPLLTTPAGIVPHPPSVQAIRIPRGVNVDQVPLIVRGPMEPARLVFVPRGIGQPVRLETGSVVGLPRIVCPPAQGSVADLVRLPLGQPPPPGSILSGPPPFVSGNQIMIRPSPMIFQQVPEHRAECPQSAPPQIIQNLPISHIPRMSSATEPLFSNMAEIPFPPVGGQPPLPNMLVPPVRPSQPQSALSSSSVSSPSSGSQDAEDLLLERYSAKPEPPQSKPEPPPSIFPSQKPPDLPKLEPPQSKPEPRPSVFPSQKPPDLPKLESPQSKREPPPSVFPSQKPPGPPKPPIDTQQQSPDRLSEPSEKSSDNSQPPQLQSVPDLKTTVTTSAEVVVTSASDSLPSDPRLLVQFLLKQTRQTTVVSDISNSPVSDKTESIKPAHPKSENLLESVENSPEKPDQNKMAYSPSQADYLGEDDGDQQSENVREMKVRLWLLFVRLIFL